MAPIRRPWIPVAEEADNFVGFSIVTHEPLSVRDHRDDDFKVGDFGEDFQTPLRIVQPNLH